MTDKEAKAILIDKVKPCLNGTDWEYALDMAIKALEQEPKTGHWMKQDLGYQCSNCTLCTNEKGRLTYNYCPNCGCRMVDPQESEE